MNMNIDLNEKNSELIRLNPNKKLIEFRGVYKTFSVNQQLLPVIQDFNLDVFEGEFIAIVGSSGCGKSTLLRLLAGLDQDFEGQISIDGQVISGIGKDRAVVFQEHRLFPWLNVEQNIELGLINETIPLDEKVERIAQVVELIGLNGFEKAYPHQLSGECHSVLRLPVVWWHSREFFYWMSHLAHWMP